MTEIKMAFDPEDNVFVDWEDADAYS